MAVARRRARYADLEKVPENLVAEIIDGELYASPRPRPAHGFTASAIGAHLFDRYGGPPGGPPGTGGWWILPEPELHFVARPGSAALRSARRRRRRSGLDVLVPDIAGWRRERLPALPSSVGITVAPDWVCEVISPTTARLDRLRKMPIYAREGVRFCWLVDPNLLTLEVFRLENGRWVVAAAHGGSEKVRVEPFPEFEIDLKRWWAEPAETHEAFAGYGNCDERALLYPRAAQA